MRPQPDDTSIKLPVTFDYKGGRSDNVKGNVLFTLVTLVLSIALTVIVVRGDAEPVKKAIIIGVAWIVVLFFIRFKVLHEQMYSDAFEALKEIDYTPDTDSFWNIYEIESSYPYICHFRDGKSGIFIRLEKDVIVGKDDDVMYRHFEAISDAFNLAGSVSINMCQIDYMDNVGNDARLQGLYEHLNDCDNPDMKEALLSIYSNLQDEMSHAYASFDVYLFTCVGKTDRLWYNVNSIVDRLLAGNYLSFKALDIDGVRTTCMALFNLNEFSALEACEHIVATQRYRGIVPIKVLHVDNTETIINKTQEQLRQEAAERLKALEEEKKNRGRKSKTVNKAKLEPSTDDKTESVKTSSESHKADSNNTAPMSDFSPADNDDNDLNNLFD